MKHGVAKQLIKIYDHLIGVEESRKVTGDVLITPELKSDFQGMFTPYLKPGR